MTAFDDVLANPPRVSPVMVDEQLRGKADARKPKFVELRCDGVSPDAIQTLFGARDVIARCRREVVTVIVDGKPVEKVEPDAAWHARMDWEVMEYLRLQDKFFPVSADEVPPMEREPFTERTVDVRGDWDELAERVLAEQDEQAARLSRTQQQAQAAEVAS